MKRNILILLIFVLYGFVYSQNKVFKCEENDYLDYFFDTENNSFHVYVVNDNARKEILSNINITFWGMYQISEDKKRIIFFEDTDDLLVHLIIVDGRNGNIKKLRDVPRGSMMDVTGQYMLINTEKNVFELMNLSNGKIEKQFQIQLKRIDNEYAEKFFIYRSVDNDNYDFLLVYGHERLTSAKVYLNIKNEDILVEYDDTDKSETEMRVKEKYGKEYLGWK